MSRLAIILALLTLPAITPAWASPGDEATAVAQKIVSGALSIVRDETLTLEQRRGQLQTIADETFDFGLMAKLALARTYKKLTPEQRTDFTLEFKRNLTLTYGSNLEGYSDEGLTIGNAREHKKGDVTVSSAVVGGKNDGASVDYRMRKVDGEWKVIDVIVEGISLIKNYRAQVQDIVRSKGADQLIAQLREKNNARDARRR